ncbi:type II toxin-antitoxin system VapC family toxin (plasmid) [Deinococcus sp. QL22]|nr:type II toxin-antitoxin system VapC family toxin [Deinococcus sp. QL22]
MIRLYSAEPGRDDVLAQRDAASGIVTHDITYVELRAGMAGRLARKLITRRAYGQALTSFEADWPTFAHVGVNDALVRSAGDLAEAHGLKAYDAVHLAAAVKIAPLGLRFMTFDNKLQTVARVALPGQVWGI